MNVGWTDSIVSIITCVAANVSFELSVVAESHLTVGASESLRPLFLGRSRGGIGGRRMEVVHRFVAGQLVELADFVGAHSQSGQLRRMQGFRRCNFQGGQELFHGRNRLRRSLSWMVHPMSWNGRHHHRRRAEGVGEERRVSGAHGQRMRQIRSRDVMMIDGRTADGRSFATAILDGRTGRLFLDRRWNRRSRFGLVPRTEDFLTDTRRNEGHFWNG